MPKTTKNKTVGSQIVENAPRAAATPSVPPPARDEVGFETVNVGQETLDLTPVRLMQLLRGIGTLKLVREALRPLGYTAAEHTRGWNLLHACSGFTSGESDEGDDEVSAAVDEIDSLDEPRFTIAEAALRHRHPAQHAYVFRDLKAARGVASVVSMHTFLTRLDALESSPEREETRAADHAALATLAARGITPAERARIWELVRKAQTLTEDAAPDASELSAAEQEKRLRAARAFYEEWSTIARTVVTRRDHLIRLGLAQRKYASDEPADGPTPDAPKPA